MKNLIHSIAIFLFPFSLFLTSASAADFSKAYMVSGLGDTTEKTGDYILGKDQPWFFTKFSDLATTDAVVGNSITTAIWTWDDNPQGHTYIKVYNNAENGIWGSLINWKSDEQLGNWSIQLTTPLNANAGTGISSGTYEGNLKFKVSNVTPEPASMILYVLGGFSMIVGFFRKKKA